MTIADSIPSPAFSVPELSATLHRYYDFDYDYRDRDRLKKWYDSQVKYGGWSDLLNIPCTKIGTTYFEVQPGWDPREDLAKLGLGSFKKIATLYAIGGFGDRWPFLDVESIPYSVSPPKSLRFPGDPGHMIFFGQEKANETRTHYIPG